MGRHTERDLSNAFYRATERLPAYSGGTVVGTRLGGEKVVIKKYANRKALDIELRAYERLRGATIAPRLLAEDKSNCMLAFQHVGPNVGMLRVRAPELYRRTLPRLQAQLDAAIECLWQTYGIVHDDVRPRNLCVDDAGVLRVIDYGSHDGHGRLLRGPGEGERPVAPRLPPPLLPGAVLDAEAAAEAAVVPQGQLCMLGPAMPRLSLTRTVGRW